MFFEGSRKDGRSVSDEELRADPNQESGVSEAKQSGAERRVGPTLDGAAAFLDVCLSAAVVLAPCSFCSVRGAPFYLDWDVWGLTDRRWTHE